MTEQAGTAPAALAPRFDALRPELLALAYRLLGSRSDAEDVVQDAWVRLHRSVVGNGDPPDSLRGWARTTVSRLCLDLLTSARRRREAYIGQWLPEPWIIDDADPQDRISLDESVGYALLVVLQTLSPAERTAWVLHVSFGMPYDQVGTIVGRTAEACRQLVARARRHLADRAPRFDVDAQAHRRVVDRFMAATAAGDLAGLVEVLDPNVTWRGDGGGKVSAARRPVTGSLRVAGLLLGVIARSPYPDTRTRVVRVNGGAGLLVYAGDRLVMLAVLSIADDVIVEIDVIVNPDKLAQVDPASTDR